MKSVQAVYAWLQTRYPGRVHRPRTHVFAGRPGHHYLVPAPDSAAAAHELMAAISALSANAEASLVRLNDAFVVTIARASTVSDPVTVPRRTVGISRFEWLAHTHPVELESRYGVAPNLPTQSDVDALTKVNHIWGQETSTIVVCGAGEVLEVVHFSVDG